MLLFTLITRYSYPRCLPTVFSTVLSIALWRIYGYLTKWIIQVYTFGMGKGPKGYKEQLIIALELGKGVPPVAVSDKLGIPKSTVYGISKHLETGWKPDLSEEAIANAPLSPGFQGKSGVKHSESSSENAGEKTGEKTEKKDTHPASGYIGFAALQLRCQYTPTMYMARLAAEDKWDWPGNLPFEDFIDKILYHFFKDRGIILQGYIVEDEVGGDGNGEIKVLQKQVEELTSLIKQGA